MLLHASQTQSDPPRLDAKHGLGNRSSVYAACYVATIAGLDVKWLVFAVGSIAFLISVQKCLDGCPVIDIPAVYRFATMSLPYDVQFDAHIL
jgi:hypothetical protein